MTKNVKIRHQKQKKTKLVQPKAEKSVLKIEAVCNHTWFDNPLKAYEMSVEKIKQDAMAKKMNDSFSVRHGIFHKDGRVTYEN